MGMEGTWQWYDVRSYVCVCVCVSVHEKVQQRQFLLLFFVTAALFSSSSIIYLILKVLVWTSLEFVCVSATKGIFFFIIIHKSINQNSKPTKISGVLSACVCVSECRV